MLVDIVFAAGCFWGVEKYFENINGVVDVKSGYVGGNYDSPTYEDVLKYKDLSSNSSIVNHTEAVKVTFDNSKVEVGTLIKSFWELHDPTQLNQQGNDIGNNYRSAIYWTNDNQQAVANDTKNEYQQLLNSKGYGSIVTEIHPLIKFWNAENYHQDYLKNNPAGYCPNHSTGVKFEVTQDTTKPDYEAMGAKLFGRDSHIFNVAFGKGTDPSFCDLYDKFKDTGSGVFIDKLSKVVLFETNDRFNSGTGWLSFYKTVGDSTMEIEDYSHGMVRVEVIAKESGMHLGHVFPILDGRKRFCINASVLDFVPK